ncbi:MAG: hypothetical protein ACRDKZ_09240 [Actinomycetota bacterium]
MDRLLRDRRLIVGFAGVVLGVTALRLVTLADSQVVTLEGLTFGVTLGVLLSVLQRALTVFAERRGGEGGARGGTAEQTRGRLGGTADQTYRLVRTFSIQLVFAFAFSFLIGTPIVLGYVLGASLMLLNLGLRYEPEPSIDEQTPPLR